MFVNDRRAVVIVAAAALSTLVAACAPQTTTRHTTAPTNGAGSTAATSTTTDAAPPRPSDFVVSVIVTEQKCFGSAGCNYRYTIDPEYVGGGDLPDKTTVVFTVSGGDQTQIGNFTIDGSGMATFDRETRISGPEGADLRATVTQVIPGR